MAGSCVQMPTFSLSTTHFSHLNMIRSMILINSMQINLYRATFQHCVGEKIISALSLSMVITLIVCQ